METGVLAVVAMFGILAAAGGAALAHVVQRGMSRRLAEARDVLQQSEERYRLLVDQAPDGIVVIAGRRFVYANPAAARIFDGELVGRTTLDVLHPEAVPAIEARVARIVEEGLITEPIEVRAHTLEGREIYVEVRGMPVTFGGARADLSIVRDVTERRRVERERSVTRELARRLVQRTPGGAREMRELGRNMAEDVGGAKRLEEFLASIEGMGWGELRIQSAKDGRYVVVGRNLLEVDGGALQPTCALPLGFLEGAIARVEGAPALGSETKCASMGHEGCTFVVIARPHRSAAAAAEVAPAA